ncbi:MAG: family 16 glycosylhydrolase [Thermoanaerobaculia bacterium]
MRKNPAFRHCTNRRRAPHHMTISLVAVFLLSGCCSYRIHPPAGSISGRVVDPQDHAVAGVEVRLGDRRVAVTDRNGKFTIRAVPSDDRLAVSFSAPKFMSTTHIFGARAASDGNTVIIWPRAAPVRLPTAVGGKLEFNGATIVFPPDAFVDAKGRQVKGDVNVSLSVLDVADRRQLASAPGDFTARMRDGSIRDLETFGLFELVVFDGDGRRVDFARDRTARVELTVPDSRREVPQSVGSFSFDERSGRWVQRTSTWQLQSSILSTTLTQNGSSGWWNADYPIDTTCLRVQLLDCHTCLAVAPPVPNVWITATGSGYNGAVKKDDTDGNGIACIPVKTAAHVQLDLDVNQGLQINPLIVATNSADLDPSDCNNCPLVTATHVLASSFSLDPLMAPNTARWCASEGYSNGSPFAVGWLDDNSHVGFPGSGLVLTMNDTDGSGVQCSQSLMNCGGELYAGGEYHTTCFHGYGTYSATITPPAQVPSSSGVVTTFFTYTDDKDGTIGVNGANAQDAHDEVDVELLGRPWIPGFDNDSSLGLCTTMSLIMQTNYFGRHVGGHEKTFCLPYGTHTYSFKWTATSIIWFVDGSQIHMETPGVDPWPTQPGRVFMNIWASAPTVTWAGTFDYSQSGPKFAVFSNVSVP